jgi:putative SOS response-associated peptidase YedK
MCGRFTNRLTWEEIVRSIDSRFQAPPHNLPPRYNIYPTDPEDVATERDGNRDFVRMRWGLDPTWWPKPLKGLKAATFNARAETVADRPFFRGCLPTNPLPHPCVGILRVAGYRDRQAAFTRADGAPMTFAAVGRLEGQGNTARC